MFQRGRLMSPAALAAVLVTISSACQHGMNEPLADRPDFTGVVTIIQVDGLALRLLLDRLGFPEGQEAPYEQVVVRAETGMVVLIQRANGSWAGGRADDIAVGDSVRVWHTGVELRSLPPQVFARRIEVVFRAPS